VFIFQLDCRALKHLREPLHLLLQITG
jgi:hypothetical protein